MEKFSSDSAWFSSESNVELAVEYIVITIDNLSFDVSMKYMSPINLDLHQEFPHF